MNYTYTGSGLIQIKSCIKYYFSIYLVHKWAIGDICFLRYRAIKGKLEKVAIKDIRIVSNRSTGGQKVFIYVDTMNYLYNEDELITELEAVELARDYYQRMINLALLAKRPCNQT